MITPPNINATVSRKIENHMAAKDIKRKKLVEATGLTYPRFKRRMRGELPFTIVEIWQIAEALRTFPSDILPDDYAALEDAA